jgi:hypothetical protein
LSNLPVPGTNQRGPIAPNPEFSNRTKPGTSPREMVPPVGMQDNCDTESDDDASLDDDMQDYYDTESDSDVNSDAPSSDKMSGDKMSGGHASTR